MIRMEHPKLPGQPIYVRPGGVASRRRSGWREAPEPEPKPAEEPEPKSTRRRRTVTTEEERNGTAEAHHD